jgi:Flp pilus assembly protein TadG
MHSSRERGFVLIAMSISMVLMLAVIGLAFDFGRIYIARNEAQAFTDAASLAAVSHLDGTETGIERAQKEVARIPIRWDLGTKEFTGVIVEFSKDGVDWERNPKDPAVTMARVSAPANSVEITFLRAVGGPAWFTVPARSVAATNPPRWIE